MHGIVTRETWEAIEAAASRAMDRARAALRRLG